MTSPTLSKSPKDPSWMYVLVGVLLLLPFLHGCASRPTPALPAPPPVVKVAVPVPCEVAEVAQPARPADRARGDDNIFDLTKVLLADRKVLEGEVKELRKVNEEACK